MRKVHLKNLDRQKREEEDEITFKTPLIIAVNKCNAHFKCLKTTNSQPKRSRNKEKGNLNMKPPRKQYPP